MLYRLTIIVHGSITVSESTITAPFSCSLATCFWQASMVLDSCFRHFTRLSHNQISQHGIKYFYKNKTGFLDLPMPRVLWQQYKTTGIDDDVMLRMVFPLLVLICSIMIGFVAIHVYYVVTARTTLEHKIMLYILKDKLKARATREQSQKYCLYETTDQSIQSRMESKHTPSAWTKLVSSASSYTCNCTTTLYSKQEARVILTII